MRTLKLFIPLLFCFYFSDLQAQKTVINQEIIWIRYNNQLRFSPLLNLQTEIEERRFLNYSQRHHFIMHTRLHYRFAPNADVGGGVTYSRQSAQFPNLDDNLVVPEIRFVQEINYTIPLSKRINFQQRFRVDERFIRANDGTELIDGFNFNWRFRFRFQGTFRMNKDESKKNTVLKVFDEVMFNAGQNIVYNQFDQNRIYVGIEQVLSKKFSLELGYLNWYQQTAAGDRFFSRDIIRLTLFHNINLHND
jgi:hypothetical protein